MTLRLSSLGTASGKFGGRRNGLKRVPGKHFLKEAEELIAQKAVRSKHFPAVKTEGAAIEC